jgi:hypothetical protein
MEDNGTVNVSFVLGDRGLDAGAGMLFIEEVRAFTFCVGEAPPGRTP